MSKYEIHHICGHRVTHNIVGTNVNGERERKARWLAGRSCTDCYRAEQSVPAADLPPLTGSEKQVAWAESLRRSARNDLLGRLQPGVESGQMTIHQAERVAITMVSQMTEASWWIDNRPDGKALARLLGQDAYASALEAAGVVTGTD